ncbi:MAG: hypothetical protein JW881_05420 [Spirochaetales bacterium]|nr:hypothetical protein [Spirochaetales bacterium]
MEKKTLGTHIYQLLVSEREKLKQWVLLGEKIEEAITAGKEEKLEAYKMQEKFLCGEIASYEKLLPPLKRQEENFPTENEDIKPVKDDIERLMKEVIHQHKRNRKHLEKKLAGLKTELDAVRKKKSSRIRSRKTSLPSFIDISV